MTNPTATDLGKDVFTTFEVGRICGVFHTTVINWINKGRLKAYTTPGKHRRIQKTDLLEFMKKFNIRIPKGFEDGERRVLVIDDEPHILQLIGRILTKSLPAAHVQLFSNAVEALVEIGKNIPDLIILDVVMPSMDGIEVCKTLRSAPQTARIRIIAVTGKKLSDEQETYLRQNVESVFRKPFSPMKLAETAVSLVDQTATRQ
jgi:excisionase family DNA binding protein